MTIKEEIKASKARSSINRNHANSNLFSRSSKSPLKNLVDEGVNNSEYDLEIMKIESSHNIHSKEKYLEDTKTERRNTNILVPRDAVEDQDKLPEISKFSQMKKKAQDEFGILPSDFSKEVRRY